MSFCTHAFWYIGPGLVYKVSKDSLYFSLQCYNTYSESTLSCSLLGLLDIIGMCVCVAMALNEVLTERLH